MTTGRPDLSAVRQQIDVIDDQLLDLLKQRAQLMDQVAAAKGASGAALNGRDVVRPGREAQVLRRLLANADISLQKRLIVSLWRDIIGAFSTVQGAFKAVVFDPDPVNGAYRAVARDYYGSAVPARLLISAAAAVRAVAEGAATVAVLPLPVEGEAAPWWPMLMGPEGRTPSVVARLPFLRAPGEPEALVVSLASIEPTGLDESLVAVELDGDISRGRLFDAFRTAGLVPRGIQATKGRDGREMLLLEVEGFVAAADPRLHLVLEHTGPAVGYVQTVGAYPLPATAK